MIVLKYISDVYTNGISNNAAFAPSTIIHEGFYFTWTNKINDIQIELATVFRATMNRVQL